MGEPVPGQYVKHKRLMPMCTAVVADHVWYLSGRNKCDDGLNVPQENEGG